MPKKVSKIPSGTSNNSLQAAMLSSISGSLGLSVSDNTIDFSSIGFSGWKFDVTVENTTITFELKNGMSTAALKDNRPSSDYRSSGYITTIGLKDITGDAILVSLANSQDEWHVDDGCVFMFFIAKDTLGNTFCGIGDKHIKHIMCESKHAYSINFPEYQFVSNQRMMPLCLMANYATYDIPVAKTLMSPIIMPISGNSEEKRGMIMSISGNRYAVWDVLSSNGLINQICPVINF